MLESKLSPMMWRSLRAVFVILFLLAVSQSRPRPRWILPRRSEGSFKPIHQQVFKNKVVFMIDLGYFVSQQSIMEPLTKIKLKHPMADYDKLYPTRVKLSGSSNMVKRQAEGFWALRGKKSIGTRYVLVMLHRKSQANNCHIGLQSS